MFVHRRLLEWVTYILCFSTSWARAALQPLARVERYHVEHGSQLWHVGDDVYACFFGFTGVLVELRELVNEMFQFDRGDMRPQSGD